MYFLVFLTGTFALRAGEAVALRREDFQLDAEEPYVHISGRQKGAGKSPGKVYISAKNLSYIKAVFDKGIKDKREVKGRHGATTRVEKYITPAKGRALVGNGPASSGL